MRSKIFQDITLTDLEPLVADGAFNEVGGLQYSRMIEKSLVDVFVPFLPLERRHVKICIRKEFQRRLGSNQHVPVVGVS